MDTNAHSELYGNETNRRGEIFEEFILAHNFKVENRGREPTFESHNGATIIDVTMTLATSLSVSDWQVDRSYNGSDHNTITFSLGREKIQDSPHRPWNKADWFLFRDLLQKETFNIPSLITDKKLDRLLDSLYKKINAALGSACPLTTAHSRDLNNRWFDDRVEELRLILLRPFGEGEKVVVWIGLKRGRRNTKLLAAVQEGKTGGTLW